MHEQRLRECQHVQSFSQDKVTTGERRTWIVIAVTSAMMAVEIAAGMIYGSMALLADGLHMGSHATALAIAAFAYLYARRHAYDRRFSFGTGKVNALGGFTGALLLAGFALMMAVESIDRFLNPVEIAFDSAILVAVIGLLVNGACALILQNGEHGHGHHHANAYDHGHTDYNLRSAYLHVIADAATSLLAIFALVAAKYFGFAWMDPAMGIVGAALVTRWSWTLLRDTGGVLLDKQAPDKLCTTIRNALAVDRDARINDLHVWAIGPNLYAAIVSVLASEPKPVEHYKRLIDRDRSLVHVTVEVRRCPP
jgi:cation diffusion facilitator family transporter